MLNATRTSGERKQTRYQSFNHLDFQFYSRICSNPKVTIGICILDCTSLSTAFTTMRCLNKHQEQLQTLQPDLPLRPYIKITNQREATDSQHNLQLQNHCICTEVLFLDVFKEFIFVFVLVVFFGFIRIVAVVL